MSTSKLFALLTMIVWAPHMPLWCAFVVGIWFAVWSVVYLRGGD